MSTQTERTTAHAAFVARHAFVEALRVKHGFAADDVLLEGDNVTAFFAELAAYDAADVKPGAPSPLTPAMIAALDEAAFGDVWLTVLDRDGAYEVNAPVGEMAAIEAAPEEAVADINSMTVAQLRDSGYCVIVWTPEEIGEADIGDLESVSIERGHDYLEGF